MRLGAVTGMKCPSPKCKENVVQTSPDGSEQRLRIKGALVHRNGALECSCYWCGEPLRIPAQLVFTGEPALRVVVPPRLLLTPPTDKA